MKWGIIGYGSIGKRHSKNIASLGDEVFVITKSLDCPFPVCNSFEQLIQDHHPDFIIICNVTSLHLESYKKIRALDQQVTILIEKPVFDKKYALGNDPNTFAAYCLRFHPLIERMKTLLVNQKCLSAYFYAGQYLPTWRPERDYRTTYSAKKNLGGGVLRDLSHEIDLAAYLLGPLNLKYSRSMKISSLEIESDDSFTGHFSTPECSTINVELNYLDRIGQRFCIFNTENETYRLDFKQNDIVSSSNTEKLTIDSNEMYLTMLKDLRSKKTSSLTSFSEAQAIMELIHQVEVQKDEK